MTVVVACNLPDGVVLGTDSVVSIVSQENGQLLNFHEDTEKLFKLGNKPIGIAVFGRAFFSNMSIGNYIRQFEAFQSELFEKETTMEEIVDALRSFFMDMYESTIEEEYGMKWSNVPFEKRQDLGIVVGGFSDGEDLSEIWQIAIPAHNKKGSAVKVLGQGKFGQIAFGMFDPIKRYLCGYSNELIKDYESYFKDKKQVNITNTDIDSLQKILDKHEYKAACYAMPIKVGVEYVRFLIGIAINHCKYVTNEPEPGKRSQAHIVGGKIQIGTVTYRGEPFQILES